MVLTINPVVYGNKSKWVKCVLLHLTGSAFGGALVVVVGWAIINSISVDTTIRYGVSSGILVAAAVLDAWPTLLHIPSPKRQVPDHWRTTYKAGIVAFGFGLELGMGITTRVRYALVYAAIVVGALLVSLEEALVVGAVFGLARGAIVVVGLGAPSFRAVEGRALGFRRFQPWVRAAVIATALVCAGGMVAELGLTR
jgi:hypothetical protein